MPPPLAINILEDELEQGAAFCRSEGLGLELTPFAFPSGLDDGLEARIERHAAAVDGLAWTSVHGPFLDLYVTSPDPEVVAVCRRRHRAALEAAYAVGASLYVAHLNSVPLIRSVQYRERFARAAAEFWLPFADAAGKHGVTIVLENMWEQGPELQKAVVTRANHPAVQASFDNGHALVFSEIPASRWIEALGTDLAHCHLHDNDGTYDQHRAAGDGIEDWSALTEALARHAPGARVVLESDHLEANRRSLENLRSYFSD
jgi:sugar phosphate isomerase/epimerase